MTSIIITIIIAVTAYFVGYSNGETDERIRGMK